MVVVMDTKASEADIERVVHEVEAVGGQAFVSPGKLRTVIGLVGDTARFMELPLATLPHVEQVIRVGKPYKLVARELHQDATHRQRRRRPDRRGHVHDHRRTVRDRDRGRRRSRRRRMAQDMGAHILRGDAYKHRSSPYAFQGLAKRGLEILQSDVAGDGDADRHRGARARRCRARRRVRRHPPRRHAQHAELPAAPRMRTLRKPVMLKRGMASTIEEWLMAAEYVAREGNTDIILCERGIRTYEPAYRNTLDIAAVPATKALTHLPVIVDPSHSGGRKELVAPLARAAVAAGADAVMIDIHPDPAHRALRRAAGADPRRHRGAGGRALRDRRGRREEARHARSSVRQRMRRSRSPASSRRARRTSATTSG